MWSTVVDRCDVFVSYRMTIVNSMCNRYSNNSSPLSRILLPIKRPTKTFQLVSSENPLIYVYLLPLFACHFNLPYQQRPKHTSHTHFQAVQKTTNSPFMLRYCVAFLMNDRLPAKKQFIVPLAARITLFFCFSLSLFVLLC